MHDEGVNVWHQNVSFNISHARRNEIPLLLSPANESYLLGGIGTSGYCPKISCFAFIVTVIKLLQHKFMVKHFAALYDGIKPLPLQLVKYNFFLEHHLKFPVQFPLPDIIFCNHPVALQVSGIIKPGWLYFYQVCLVTCPVADDKVRCIFKYPFPDIASWQKGFGIIINTAVFP